MTWLDVAHFALEEVSRWFPFACVLLWLAVRREKRAP